jgi:hypothetical protein
VRLVFPLAIVTMMAAAAVPYLAAGDWRRGVYWIAAAAINLVVTI